MKQTVRVVLGVACITMYRRRLQHNRTLHRAVARCTVLCVDFFARGDAATGQINWKLTGVAIAAAARAQQNCDYERQCSQ